MFSVKTTGKPMTLDLTEEQYRRLLTLLALGNSCFAKDTDKMGIGNIDIQQHIMSFYKKFNAADLVLYYDDIGMFSNSKTLRNKVHKLVDKYDEQTVLFGIIDKLADKDFEELLKQTSIPENDHAEELERIQLEYLDEFEKNGFKNLILVKPK